MKAGTYQFNLYPDAADWPRRKLVGFLGAELPENAEPVPMTLELTQTDGGCRAVLTTPRGKQRISGITCSDYTAAWEAFAGPDGCERFRFVLTASDSSYDVWGFAAGRDSFRGFIGFTGKYIGE